MNERDEKYAIFDRLNENSPILKLLVFVLGLFLLIGLCVYYLRQTPRISNVNRYETRKEEWKRVEGKEVLELRKRVQEEEEKGRR